MRFLVITILVVFFGYPAVAQQVQVVRGTVIDQSSNVPVSYANVTVQGKDTLWGAETDSLGSFRIAGVPVGRYDIKVSVVGYQSFAMNEVEVSVSKEVVLTLAIKEATSNLGEVVVRYKANKALPLNNMATVSSRMLSVEEAKKYAGGFDDPARLAASFAGVASNLSSNGIVVRGNAPQYLQWKLEGVEIPNPNHFADLSAFGGGGLTALSANLLANSDFFTGAFPAEYGNALSGVFDLYMRNGNNQKRETTFQWGLIGIDASSEGPFKKGGTASYLFNYRYATLSLLAPLLPENAGGVKYQDFSFKLNFPTRKAGTFSVWGIGLKDRSGADAEKDSTKWVYASDREQSDIHQFMAAAGVSHKYFFNTRTYLRTILSATTSGLDVKADWLTNDLSFVPANAIKNINTDVSLASYLNTKFSSKHTNRTGILLRGMLYNLSLDKSLSPSLPMVSVVDAAGFSSLLSCYSNSSVSLSSRLRMNAGINAQVFTLNGNYTIEPRLGFIWQAGKKSSFAAAYGLHSRLERINFYFNNSLATGQKAVNKNMDFSKAHHFVLGYDLGTSDALRFKAEVYYQYLFSIPVVADSSLSFINMQNDWFFAERLQNTGTGANYGVDLTLEKYLTHGYYFLFTTSLFNSQYRGGDGVWRNTRYNRSYLFNFLVGREWVMGAARQNVFSLNTRVTYQGGDRYSPVNAAASLSAQDVVFDERQAFSAQLPATFTMHLTTSYKINRKHTSHEIAFKILNLTGQKEYYGYNYNYVQRSIDKQEEALFIPNLSYRIEF